MQEKYIEVNGLRTRYASAGEQGPALILLHGLGASLETWWCNIDALGQHFRVIAPDIVYFGKSAKPQREPNHAAFVEFTMALMDTLGIERAVLVGNSMGGAIAAKTAMLHPNRVPGLVLVNSAGFGQEVAWWLRLRSVVNARPQGTPPAWLIRIGLKQIFDDPDRVSAELLEKLVANDRDPEAQKSYRRVLSIGVNWRGLKPEMLREIRDAAHEIRVPTLIVWGKQDRVVPVQHAKVAHSKIPNARLHVFDKCGHTPQIEYPAEFNRLIRNFVQETIAAPV